MFFFALKGAELAQSMHFFQTFVFFYVFTNVQHTTTAENRVIFKMHDFPTPGKNVQDAAVFSGSAFQKFQPHQLMHNDVCKIKLFTTPPPMAGGRLEKTYVFHFLSRNRKNIAKNWISKLHPNIIFKTLNLTNGL